MAEQKGYPRFPISQRLEHWVLTISFTLLAVTGLPQKFVGNDWAESAIGLMGGIELVRTIHHIAAVIMVVAAIYHVLVLAYKVYVQRVRWTMFPRLDDAIDALDTIRYNLGLAKERPKMDRYNFAEKAEYWALVWGTVIMALTGFFMLNPVITTQFLPGDIIPAAKAAHGGEAILAVLAIILWHFYNVHIKEFSRAMFTGKVTEHQMVEEHALELERINKGQLDRGPAPEVLKKRERIFIPVATIAAVFMVVTLYFLAAYENTAITTMPRRAQVLVYAPITMTPMPKLASGTPAAQPVSAGNLPANHNGRTSCLTCHANLAQPAVPEDHAGRSDTTCTACHKPAGAPSAATAVPTAPASTSSGGAGTAKPLPASHAGRTTCLSCHGNGIGPAIPTDHAGRQDATCTACHKPQ